jgi:tryptophan-rich sensory protein
MIKIQWTLIASIIITLFIIAFTDDYLNESIISLLKLLFYILFGAFAALIMYTCIRENNKSDNYTEEW